MMFNIKKIGVLILVTVSCLGCGNATKELQEVKRLESKGDYKNALKKIESLAEDDPDNTEILFVEAGILSKMGRVEEAEKCLTRVLKISPNHEMARFKRARIRNQRGHYFDAYYDYKKILFHRGYGSSISVNWENGYAPKESDLISIQLVAFEMLPLADRLAMNKDLLMGSELCLMENYKEKESLVYRGKALIRLGYCAEGCQDLKLAQERGAKFNLDFSETSCLPCE